MEQEKMEHQYLPWGRPAWTRRTKRMPDGMRWTTPQVHPCKYINTETVPRDKCNRLFPIVGLDMNGIQLQNTSLGSPFFPD